ncbi:MAG TPA: multidrug efflux SMR transporter [Pseudonocardia sp.]|jgi:small multidrug resistance pump|nr:multidrug efflux SMR transporter [Pseudonocardia sp.]
MSIWFLLGCAILSEVSATVSLKLSDGFSKLVPAAVVVIGYLASFVLLGMVLKRGMSVGVAYGVWSACGVALVALIGVAFLKETLTWIQVGGLVLVIAGVVAIEMGAAA